MDGGGESRPPLMRPQSNQKRSFSTMAASHRDEAFPLRDEHYENEHAARRRRFEAELRPARTRFPGDGLDFRTPLMSTSTIAPAVASAEEEEEEEEEEDDNVNARMDRPAVIDLTDDDETRLPRGLNRQDTWAAIRSERAGHWVEHMAIEAMRGNVIDLENSAEERDDGEEYDASELPGASYLALPGRRQTVHHPRMRRSPRPRSPAADMDDVQFIEQRPVVPPHRASASLPSTPRLQRTITPHASRQNDPIDLTEDDDDLILVDHAQGDGVNLTRPEATAGAGTRSMADRGFQHMGQIVNLLRETGAQLGGRLHRRALNAAGPGVPADFEQQPLPAPRNGPLPPHRMRPHHHHNQYRHHHHHHHHTHLPPPHQGLVPRQFYPQAVHAVAQALGVQNEMAGLMNYHMTGFDVETGRENNRPPTPKYEPPPPALEGFTRSPAEAEIVVCPNCGDELAMGEEGIKREVWVVKGCGHAYCGECAHNRVRPPTRKSKKGKAPVQDNAPHLPEPFSKCVVPGCAKPTGRQSMIHVYLGS